MSVFDFICMSVSQLINYLLKIKKKIWILFIYFEVKLV